MLNPAKFISKSQNVLFSGNERSVRLKKNISFSLLLKGVSISIGFLIVPITLGYIDVTRYGIWLTISSFLQWFSFLEIGLGNGLKNKLAEALALKDYFLAKIYVSTTYAILGIMIILAAIAFNFINSFVPWSRVFNAPKGMEAELFRVISLVINLFFLRFILRLISEILAADQRIALYNSFGPVSNLGSLLLIYYISKHTDGSLYNLCLIYSICPIVVYLIASFILFNKDYRAIRPSLKNVKFRYAKVLMGLGMKFFIIQIAGLLMFQSSNIIISQLFGPDQVAPYNLAKNYFSVTSMIFTIIISPVWPAFTEAWTKNDRNWIIRILVKLIKIWMLVTFLGLLMLMFSNQVYHLWLKNKVMIPFLISALTFLYFSTSMFGGIFTIFLNSVSKMNLQAAMSFISPVVFLLTIFVFHNILNMNVEGIILASIISNFYGLFIAPVQVYKILSGKADGFWAK